MTTQKSNSFSAHVTLQRILPHVKVACGALIGKAPERWDLFEERLRVHWDALFEKLVTLYHDRFDLYYHLEQILILLATTLFERDDALMTSDKQRSYNKHWFQDNGMVGGALYVNLFSENLGKLRENIPYFKELGLTYIHLMPLFAVRPGDNDGGYAVSNYRSINPELGTIDDLVALAYEMHEAGIVLVLDFIFNHTSDDHIWAQKAQSGDSEFQDYYYIFPDRTEPDKYEAHLREIFPTVRRGNFTWHDGMEQWVWTTFNSFQWDLKYSNPAVFTAMLGEMLFLANCGVDILRLDAVAFIWKKMGTNCENLPEAHTLIQAFNAAVRIAAPGVLFKSEAIVHPDQVLEYVSSHECQLSYNPLLMALLWESLATRKISLLANSIRHRHPLTEECAWCNYLRCHDDIGWTFDDSDAAQIGINAHDHRAFLNRFYTGQHEGSFARGIPFQYNPSTGDMRISGTLASLAGLEQAIETGNKEFLEMAIRRIMLLHSVILSIGGIPLLYLGEEWGLMNDYDYITDPAKAGDSRWVHRPKIKWEYLADLSSEESIHHRIFSNIKALIQLRKDSPALAGASMEIVDLGNEHLLGYVRSAKGSRLLLLCNFSETEQEIDGNVLRTTGLARFFTDTVSGETISTSQKVVMDGYQFRWLQRS